MSSIYSRRYILRQGKQALLGFSVANVLNGIKQSIAFGDNTLNHHSIEAVIHNLTEQIPLWMKQFKIPGLSLAVIQEKKAFWHHSFGVRNYYSQKPVDDRTIFAAASLSKPLFAYAVIKMVERGYLNLDTPLTEYTAKPYIKDDRLKLITARRVLSHTTGFPNWSGDEPVWIENTPGKKFGYSGEGYLYLQKVIEEITNQPFEQYIFDQLLAPLSMNQSSYVWQPAYQYLATDGHDRDLIPRSMKKPTEALSAGSLRTTAQEYAQFMIAMMQSGTVDSHLLTESSVQEMLRSQIQLNYHLDWGLGWGLEYSNNQKYFWHWGDAGIYKSFAIASRELDTGVVILTNSENGLKICPPIVSAVMSGDRFAFDFEMMEY
ncbi:serine hydrolase [Pleurocapsa sp. PCC 7319]|uniref:serine hydrolase domain-containing protein n=1 Tax=Pleurocapsa sp. PCC 7319 TaxID=118161 RepID=UPI00034A59C6|nr:serine hydrolase [Pleurocapsa sp. PCC 7319]